MIRAISVISPSARIVIAGVKKLVRTLLARLVVFVNIILPRMVKVFVKMARYIGRLLRSNPKKVSLSLTINPILKRKEKVS
jgi:hypothetical protein